MSIYLSGAHIFRKSEISIPKGETELLFEGLSSSIDINSIQLTAPGAKIISITPEYGRYTHPDSIKRLRYLKDSLEIYENQIARIIRESAGHEAEEKLLGINMSRIGSEKAVSLIELQSFSAYYQKRISEIKNKLYEFSEKKQDLELKKNRVFSQIQRISNSERDAYHIHVKLKSDNPIKLPISLSYVALNAGWSPFYDVRVKTVADKVKFAYRASLINDTNEDWENVKLKLSSANPTLSTQAPDIDPWRLDFVRYYYEQDKRKLEMAQKAQAPSNSNQINDFGFEAMEEDMGSVSRTALEGGADVNISALSVEFEIKELYTIRSDGRYYSVDVNEYELVAQYSYKCVPKLDRDAFLIANITGWEQLNLIEGKMNLYFGDTYVGDSYLNPRSATDTLKLSLGRDKKVIVKRVEVKDFSKTAFIGSNKRETMTTEIEIRNTNNIPVEIEIYDQIPISKNSEIEITPDNLGGAAHNEEKGELRWVHKLKETESKKFRFEYTVKYPKSKNIERSNYQSSQNQRKMYRK